MKHAKTARVVLGVVFAGLLVTPLLIKKLSATHTAASKRTLDVSDSIARH